MSQQDLQRQVEALNLLEGHIRRFSHDVEIAIRGYGNVVQDMLDCGVPLQIHDEFQREFQIPVQSPAGQILRINEQAISYVNQKRQLLSAVMG